MTSKTRTLSLGRPGVALRSRQGISWRYLGLRVGTARRREGEGPSTESDLCRSGGTKESQTV